MDGKHKGKLIYIFVGVPICLALAELMAYCGCRMFIDILARIYLIGGLIVAVGTGPYCFLFKSFPSKPMGSEDKASIQDWGMSILTILESRRNWLIVFDVAVGGAAVNYLSLFWDKRKIESLN